MQNNRKGRCGGKQRLRGARSVKEKDSSQAEENGWLLVTGEGKVRPGCFDEAVKFGGDGVGRSRKAAAKTNGERHWE